MNYTPDSSHAVGLTFPLIFVLTKIVATFGLIEVGETVLDPFGDDPEDFALLHFVEVTVCSSSLPQSMPPPPSLTPECSIASSPSPHPHRLPLR